MSDFVTYLSRRVRETSTWVGIGAAITGVTADAPLSYILIAVGIAGVLSPDYQHPTP